MQVLIPDDPRSTEVHNDVPMWILKYWHRRCSQGRGAFSQGRTAGYVRQEAHSFSFRHTMIISGHSYSSCRKVFFCRGWTMCYIVVPTCWSPYSTMWSQERKSVWNIYINIKWWGIEFYVIMKSWTPRDIQFPCPTSLQNVICNLLLILLRE